MPFRSIPTPAEVGSMPPPAEIMPRTQEEAAELARLQLARAIHSTVGEKNRRVIARAAGMTPGEMTRELDYYEQVLAGRVVPAIAPDQLRAIMGGGAE